MASILWEDNIITQHVVMPAHYKKLNPEPDDSGTNIKRYGIAFLIFVCLIGLFLIYYNPKQIIGKTWNV